MVTVGTVHVLTEKNKNWLFILINSDSMVFLWEKIETKELWSIAVEGGTTVGFDKNKEKIADRKEGIFIFF